MPKTQHLLLQQRSAISSLFTATEISHQPKKRKRFPLSSRNGVLSKIGALKLQLLQRSESQTAKDDDFSRETMIQQQGEEGPSFSLSGTRNEVRVRGLTATPPPRGGQNQEMLPALNPQQSLARARKRSLLPPSSTRTKLPIYRT